MINKSRRLCRWIIAAAAPLVVVIGVVGCGNHSTTATAQVRAARVPKVAAPQPIMRQPAPPMGPLTTFGDGIYRVGTAAGDITAGLYRSAGPTESMPCYWARTQDPTGKIDTIITDSYPPGPTTVTITSSDGAFLVSGCAQWSKVS